MKMYAKNINTLELLGIASHWYLHALLGNTSL